MSWSWCSTRSLAVCFEHTKTQRTSCDVSAGSPIFTRPRLLTSCTTLLITSSTHAERHCRTSQFSWRKHDTVSTFKGFTSSKQPLHQRSRATVQKDGFLVTAVYSAWRGPWKDPKACAISSRIFENFIIVILVPAWCTINFTQRCSHHFTITFQFVKRVQTAAGSLPLLLGLVACLQHVHTKSAHLGLHKKKLFAETAWEFYLVYAHHLFFFQQNTNNDEWRLITTKKFDMVHGVF